MTLCVVTPEGCRVYSFSFAQEARREVGGCRSREASPPRTSAGPKTPFKLTLTGGEANNSSSRAFAKGSRPVGVMRGQTADSPSAAEPRPSSRPALSSRCMGREPAAERVPLPGGGRLLHLLPRVRESDLGPKEAA